MPGIASKLGSDSLARWHSNVPRRSHARLHARSTVEDGRAARAKGWTERSAFGGAVPRHVEDWASKMAAKSELVLGPDGKPTKIHPSVLLNFDRPGHLSSDLVPVAELCDYVSSAFEVTDEAYPKHLFHPERGFVSAKDVLYSSKAPKIGVEVKLSSETMESNFMTTAEVCEVLKPGWKRVVVAVPNFTCAYIMQVAGKTPPEVLRELDALMAPRKTKLSVTETGNPFVPFEATVIIQQHQYAPAYGSDRELVSSYAALHCCKELFPNTDTSDVAVDDEFGTKVIDYPGYFEMVDQIPVNSPQVLHGFGGVDPKRQCFHILCEFMRRYATETGNISFVDRTVQPVPGGRFEHTFKMGGAEVSAFGDTPEEAKLTATHFVIVKLHPGVATWGELLRLYWRPPGAVQQKPSAMLQPSLSSVVMPQPGPFPASAGGCPMAVDPMSFGRPVQSRWDTAAVPVWPKPEPPRPSFPTPLFPPAAPQNSFQGVSSATPSPSSRFPWELLTSKEACSHCHGRGHNRSACPLLPISVGGKTTFKAKKTYEEWRAEDTCNYCHEKGHWQAECPLRQLQANAAKAIAGITDKMEDRHGAKKQKTDAPHPQDCGDSSAFCTKCCVKGHWTSDCMIVKVDAPIKKEPGTAGAESSGGGPKANPPAESLSTKELIQKIKDINSARQQVAESTTIDSNRASNFEKKLKNKRGRLLEILAAKVGKAPAETEKLFGLAFAAKEPPRVAKTADSDNPSSSSGQTVSGATPDLVDIADEDEEQRDEYPDVL